MIRLKNIDEENMYSKEKIISFEEAFHTQAEKAVYVESMMGRMDAERQQSEAKSKEEMQNTVQSNARAIENLSIDINSRISAVLQEIRGEIVALQDNQALVTSDLKEANQKTIGLENEQEKKLINIMKIIEDHRTLIERTHTSVTTITEKIVQNESVQSNSHERFIAENGAKIAQLQEDLERQLSRVVYQNSEQQAMIETNCSELDNLKREWNTSFGGIHQTM